MLQPAPKLRNQEIQQELVQVAAGEINFTEEISNMAQEAHAAYLEKTK